MSGEVVCNSHSEVFIPLHNTLKMAPEEPSSTMSFSQRQANGCPAEGAPCWSQLHLTQTRLCPPTEPHRSSSHTPLLSSNRSLPQQRRTAHRVRTKKQKMVGGKNTQNKKVTDFYPIRRSSRRSKSELECEQKKQMDALVSSGVEEGLEMRHVEGKGRAVVATRRFNRGDYVVEYHGDLLDITDAKVREAEYAKDPDTGCYMYYFQYLSRTYCVDATRESGRLGRLVNHSKSGNCHTKLHDIDGVPHLVLVASRDIHQGEELLYDYGDRSKASIAAHPWLKH